MKSLKLHSFLKEYCPYWIEKDINSKRIKSLSKDASDAVMRVLLIENKSVSQFSERAIFYKDLYLFDYNLNKLTSELINELSPHKAGAKIFIENEHCFFKGAPSKIIQQEIVDVLNRDGYCTSPIALGDEQLHSIKEALAKQSFRTKGTSQHTLSGKELLDIVIRGDTPVNQDGDTYWLVDMDALAHDSLLTSLAFDPYIISVVSKYLGCSPIHVQTNAWFSFPGMSTERNLSSNAQMFHQDKEFIKFIKVFVYLSDVGEEQGPHCYIEGSHLDELHRKGIDLSCRVEDKDIKKFYSVNRIKMRTGHAGQIIFGDTSCVHKGSQVKNGYRLMLQLEYASSLYLSPVAPFSDIEVNCGSFLNYSESESLRMTSNYNTKARMEYMQASQAMNRPSFPRHLKSLTLGPTRRCHEQAAVPRRVQD
ncbi:phytanoyl-CoA dioxygenase family protein [Chromobacterium vaccinii]|uniref:phytanoyl-CoA dioxygenase family protein n=1 Tax=Chromobacterium vaccinii TaxID=1108595 RepID=UPI000E189E16|nr:phytanoyl-CoA dioxygenase family protein [Chromobacterium vaccinii]SUX29964.1 Phytanoyl-CoA dioxygenase (PhyH) [Chromobacterium vaccinii]